MIRFHPIHKRDRWNFPAPFEWRLCPFLNSTLTDRIEQPGRYLYPLWISENTFPDFDPTTPDIPFTVWYTFRTLYFVRYDFQLFGRFVLYPLHLGALLQPLHEILRPRAYRYDSRTNPPTWASSGNPYVNYTNTNAMQVASSGNNGRTWPVFTYTDPEVSPFRVNSVLRPTYAYPRGTMHDFTVYTNDRGTISAESFDVDTFRVHFWNALNVAQLPDPERLLY